MSNTNTTVWVIDTGRSEWALTDDQINAAKVYDDDGEWELEVAGLSIPTFWVVMLVITFSACIGGSIFLCSYWHERSVDCYKCCPRKQESEVDDDEDEAATLQQRTNEIESRLKLKTYEHIDEAFDDDATRNSSSSDDEGSVNGMVSVVSGVSDGTSSSCGSCNSILMQDPNFVRLAQTPRCVLCSKFFNETDTVSESWEPTCNHHFHKECIVSWLQKNDGCPVCKRAYVVGLAVAEEP